MVSAAENTIILGYQSKPKLSSQQEISPVAVQNKTPKLPHIRRGFPASREAVLDSLRQPALLTDRIQPIRRPTLHLPKRFP